MPSENPIEPPGFLKAQLLDGGKGFRYRPGVRMLLGMPEAKEAPLRFAQTLPPFGFRYRAGLREAVPAKTGTAGLADRDGSVTESPSPHPVEAQGAAHPGPLHRIAPPPSGFKQTRSISFVTSPEARPPVDNKTRRAREQAGVEALDIQNNGLPALSSVPAEKTKVAIPGFSKRPQVFPALKPEASEAKKADEQDLFSATQKARPVKQGAREVMSGPDTPELTHIENKKSPASEEMLPEEKTEKMPGLAPAAGLLLQPRPEQGLRPRSAHQQTIEGGSDIRKTWNDRADTFNPAFSAAAKPSRPDPHAQIRQLRETLRTFEKNQQAREVEQAQLRTDKNREPQAPPAVILKQAPQEKTEKMPGLAPAAGLLLQPRPEQGLRPRSAHQQTIEGGSDIRKTWNDRADTFNPAFSAAAKPSRPDPHAQIRQLRETLRTFEKNQQAREAEQAQLRTDKNREPQAPPAVILKQAPPQSKTSSAFWARRYLSHAALRLRILR